MMLTMTQISRDQRLMAQFLAYSMRTAISQALLWSVAGWLYDLECRVTQLEALGATVGGWCKAIEDDQWLIKLAAEDKP
jgi:hypothetical protein